MQEDFDNIMKEYPDSSKAMDLIAEHRLRSLHASAAWQSKQDALTDSKTARSLGAKIEHVLEASSRCPPIACRCSFSGARSAAPSPNSEHVEMPNARLACPDVGVFWGVSKAECLCAFCHHRRNMSRMASLSI